MHSGGRRPKASKERNRGNGYERRCGALYGDLTAAAGAPEGVRAELVIVGVDVPDLVALVVHGEIRR